MVLGANAFGNINAWGFAGNPGVLNIGIVADRFSATGNDDELRSALTDWQRVARYGLIGQIADGVLGGYFNSSWQRAHRLLKVRAMPLLQVVNGRFVTEGHAATFATFILNQLAQNAPSVSINVALEGGPFGNGRELGARPKQVVIGLIDRDLDALKRGVQTAKSLGGDQYLLLVTRSASRATQDTLTPFEAVIAETDQLLHRSQNSTLEELNEALQRVRLALDQFIQVTVVHGYLRR